MFEGYDGEKTKGGWDGGGAERGAVFAGVEEAVGEIRAGRMVVVVDDEDRENEGDLTLAAEWVTPEAINFMAKFGRGLICLTLTEERADYLRLGPMTQENTSRFGTAFTESVEAREGVTTGISAADQGAYDSGGDRFAIDGEGSGAAGACVSAAGAEGWGAGAGGADGGFGGPGADGGVGVGWGDLRDHERGWDHGKGAGPGGVLRDAWVEDGDGGFADPVSAAA